MMVVFAPCINLDDFVQCHIALMVRWHDYLLKHMVVLFPCWLSLLMLLLVWRDLYSDGIRQTNLMPEIRDGIPMGDTSPNSEQFIVAPTVAHANRRWRRWRREDDDSLLRDKNAPEQWRWWSGHGVTLVCVYKANTTNDGCLSCCVVRETPRRRHVCKCVCSGI